MAIFPPFLPVVSLCHKLRMQSPSARPIYMLQQNTNDISETSMPYLAGLFLFFFRRGVSLCESLRARFEPNDMPRMLRKQTTCFLQLKAEEHHSKISLHIFAFYIYNVYFKLIFIGCCISAGAVFPSAGPRIPHP